MTVWEILVGIAIMIVAILVIAVILLQEGKQSSLGAISGSTESFMDKGKSRTKQQFLAFLTKVLAGTFFALVFVGMLITKFLGA